MIKQFKLLSSEEVNKFEAFVNSPYFNTNEKYIKLFKYLKSLYPFMNPADVKNEALFNRVYKEPYNAVKASRLVAGFNELFEKFVYQMEQEGNTLYNHLVFLTALRKKDFLKRSSEYLENVKTHLGEQFLKDDDYYYVNQIINYEDYNLNATELQGQFPRPLEERSQNLDYFYIFSKLHTFRDMLLHEYLSGQKFDLDRSMYNEVLLFVQENSSTIKEHHPNIHIVYLSLMMETHFNDESYPIEYKAYLAAIKDKIPKEKLRYYYNYLISFYITKINNGEISFRKELLGLLKIIDEQEIFVLRQYISEGDFNTAVITALTVGDFEWAENFISKYKRYIQPQTADGMVHLSLAKLHFYKKEYEQALKHLQMINEKASLYYISSRILEIKIAYEQKDNVRVEYLLESTRLYLTRSKGIRKSDIEMHKKFLQFVKELIKLKDSKDAIVIKKQLDKVIGFVPDKTWLYAQINELEATL